MESEFMHPLVRISIVNLDSGEFLEISESDGLPYYSGSKSWEEQRIFGQEESYSNLQIQGTDADKQYVFGEALNKHKTVYPVLTNP